MLCMGGCEVMCVRKCESMRVYVSSLSLTHIIFRILLHTTEKESVLHTYITQ